MRIIGGRHRGASLYTPKGHGTRPTAARVRESFFNIVAPELTSHTRFLDLFAGSGAIGFEALSRGVANVTMVEKNETDLIAKNAARLGYRGADKLRAIRADIFDGMERLARENEQFDIVFADPPWHEGFEERVVVAGAPLVVERGVLVIELWRKTAPPKNPAEIILEQSRRYGDTTLHFYRRPAH